MNSLFLFLWILSGFLLSNYNNNQIQSNFDILKNETHYYNQKITIKWEVENLYKENDYYKMYILKINNLNLRHIDNKIKLILNVPINISFKNWDNIEFESRITKIDKINDFEYDKYLLLRNIYGQTYGYKISKTTNNIWKLSQIIINTKEILLDKISKIYPEKESGILSWILIWEWRKINKDIKNYFNKAWLSHILVVSWYNITILIIFIWFFIRFLPRLMQVLLVFIFIFLFLSLVWIDNSPALRASIMWFVWFLWTAYWRRINIYTILSLILIIFVVLNPLSINYDISLHLSVFALLGMIVFKEKLDILLEKMPKLFFVKDILTTTLSVMIFVLPFMIVNFGEFSIIAPISNLFILPLIPIIMFIWWVSILLYLLNPVIWIFTWFCCWIFIKYIIKVWEFFWSLNFATIKINFWIMNKYFFIGYYLCIVFLLIKIYIKENGIGEGFLLEKDRDY